MKRKDFQELAVLRLREAKLLLQTKSWEGAYYLAGYAAENALKACIARQTERHEFPDKDRVLASYTHDLKKLLTVARLDNDLSHAARNQPELDANWATVTSWSERSRYERRSRAEAEALLNALRNRKHGLFRWLKQRW